MKIISRCALAAFFLSCAANLQVNAAGVIDRVFGNNGTAATQVGTDLQARKVRIQADGKILVLGNFSGSSTDTALVRYNQNGSLDTGFGIGGVVTYAISPATESANDLAFQSNGKIVVAGSYYSPATQSVDFFVARFNANGTIDSSFGVGGIASVNQSSTEVFNAVLVQPDDKIVAVGTTSQNNFDFAAIRFDQNGALDQSFADGGLFFLDLNSITNTQNFRAVALFPDGRILIGGTYLDTGGAGEVLVLLQPDGSRATAFGNNGIRQESLGNESPGQSMDLAILPGGKFLSVSRSFLRRHHNNGAVDQTFRSAFATGASDIVPLGTDLALRPDGKFFVLNQGSSFNVRDTVIYDASGRDISRVRGLSGADIAVQTDGRFIIVNAAGDSFVVTRYVSISSPGTRIADFDFDGKTDLAFLRNGTSVFVTRTQGGPIAYQLTRVPGDEVRVMAEDFVTANPNSMYYWRLPSPNQNQPAFFESVNEIGGISSTFQWGIAGDKPVGGDFDGETVSTYLPRFRKVSEYSVFRPSTGDWWVYNRQTNTFFAYHWGTSGDKPVPADYDYDGITDFAVYRPSTGTWWIHRSADDSYFTINFGIAADIPLTGDFDGDGRADFTVYRASEGNWYQFLTTDGFRVVRFGLPTDYPVPGDYDGDGKHDIAVFRDGVWYLLRSSAGLQITGFGTVGDVPVSVRYDQ